MKRAPAIAFAVLVIASMVAIPLSASVATAQSGPSGMVALGPGQVSEDLPSDTDSPIRASDLEGNVYASDHASTLEVIVTTPERADKYLENGSVIADDELAVVLRDQEVHEGRDVAVDVDVLEAGVGYQPEVAYGTHSSGEEWQSAIDVEGTNAIWNVPHFSSNTVTFSGGIELSGDAAGDGTSYEYDLDSLDGVEDYSINMTGVENTGPASTSATVSDGGSLGIDVGGTTAPREETVTIEGTKTSTRNDQSVSVSDGSSDSISVGGNQDPVGPDGSGDPEISVTNNLDTTTTTSWDGTNDISYYQIGDDSGTNFESENRIDNPPDSEIGGLKVHYDGVGGGNYGTATFDIYIASGTPDQSTGDGTLVKSDHQIDLADVEGTTQTIDLDTPVDMSGSSSVTVEFVTTSTSDGGKISIEQDDSPSTTYMTYSGGTWYERDTQTAIELVGDLEPDISVSTDTGSSTTLSSMSSGETRTTTLPMSSSTSSISADSSGSAGGSIAIDVAKRDVTATEDPSVSVGGSTVSHSGVLGDGETVTESVDLSTGSQSADVSTGGDVIVSSSWTEVTESVDPAVVVNGYETTYDGTLAEGENASLATNTAWLENGTNTVTVSTSSPATGPESLVGFEYRHDAAGTTREVDVEATSWTETFNVSNTYPSETADATATLTFVDEVAEINDVEYRVDGGTWQAPPDHDLNGTDLEVGFGDVAADTTIDVRATGHKVRAYDGDVKVTEPTVEGDELATEVEITNLSSDGMFGLRVDGTVLGDRLHYASEESWTGESAHAEIASSGTQILRAEDANVGSTMRVSTVPVSVTPESGAIEAEVEDGSEPTFSLRQGDTTGSDRVEVTYYDTVTGDRYALWSETREVEVDADRAESPVHFITGGDSETYSILQRDAGDGYSDGTGGPTGQESTLPLLFAFGGIGVVLVGTTFVSRRFGIGGWLLPVTATSLTVIAAEVLAPGSPMLRIAQLASESNAVTIGAVAALLVGMWQLDERTSGKVPWYIRGVIGVLSVVWALETLSPGVILGGIRGGVESMGPLIVIVIVGGGAYLVREWIQARRAPDTVVEFQAGEQQ